MNTCCQTSGFTLVELIIAMMVTSVMGIAVIANYTSQQQAATTVRQVSQMQQQLRGAMYIMEQDLRIAGYDPEGTDVFGVINVQRWSITNESTAAVPDANGSPSLTIAYDWDPANAAFNEDGLLNEPAPAYRLFDDNNDGIFDLVRDNVGANRQLVAEGMEAIGFAYAFDQDGDGELDRTAAGNNIIWAVDWDNDNRLDTNLDADDDGVIDLNDDIDGDRRITPADGGGLPAPVTVDRIRMVRIWLLARARNASRGFTNQGQFILVGDQVIPNQAGGFDDNIRRRLLVRTVDCRNTGI
jgi:type IV pilus assembly protein PilW